MTDKNKSSVGSTEQATDKDSKGRFTKGNKLGFQKGESGNPTGMTKKSVQVKDDIMSCFNLLEFQVWAKEHLSEFYGMIVKLLPKELHSTGDTGVVINIQQTEVISLEQANTEAKSRLGAEALN